MKRESTLTATFIQDKQLLERYYHNFIRSCIFMMFFRIMSLVYSPILLQILKASSNPANSEPDGLTTNFSASSIRNCHMNSETSRYHPHSNSKLTGCYETGFKGPCNEYMIFYPLGDDEDKTLGECDCDRNSLRTLIYHEETHRCYPIFQQGYCSNGNWLDLTPNGMPVCEHNPCYQPSTGSHGIMEDLVLLDGECVKVGEKASCNSSQLVVGFKQLKRQPTCIPNPKFATGIVLLSIGVTPYECRPGTHRAVSGRCQPSFKFDF